MLTNIRRCAGIGACLIGRGRRRSLIGFDRRLWADKIGEAPCHGSGDKNGRNSKSQADHFFPLSQSFARKLLSVLARARRFHLVRSLFQKVQLAQLLLDRLNPFCADGICGSLFRADQR
jgi:hypothetical protein